VSASPPLVALVPFRSPGTGKSRLAAAEGGGPGLTPLERGRLAEAMLADVLHALAACTVDRVVVAAAADPAAEAAPRLGVEAVLDPPGTRGLNDAIAALTARYADAEGLVVVAADLPCLRQEDLATLLGSAAEVAVAPTARGGTGGLLRRPPLAISTVYGPDSARRHLRRGQQTGARTERVQTEGFRRDVDTWSDLRELIDAPVGSATASVLAGLAERLVRTS
jgi:2-phospho-L-lactate/phosphoenolpyruvate guanylyltransferase